jgi:hypothetical protein
MYHNNIQFVNNSRTAVPLMWGSLRLTVIMHNIMITSTCTDYYDNIIVYFLNQLTPFWFVPDRSACVVVCVVSPSQRILPTLPSAQAQYE